MVVNPVTIHPGRDAGRRARADEGTTASPAFRWSRAAATARAGKLVGILTNRDVRFATDPRQKVAELMTKDNLITVREGVGQDEAKRLLHQHRIEKLLVVDDAVSLRRPDHRQGHREGGRQSERLQGRAGPAARRRRDHRRRQGLRAHRAADRRRRRPRRGRHRARPFRSMCSTRSTRIKRLSNAVQVVAGNVATARRRQGADRCRRRRDQGRHRPGLDLHHAHRRRRRRAAAHRDHGRGRGGAQDATRR